MLLVVFGTFPLKFLQIQMTERRQCGAVESNNQREPGDELGKKLFVRSKVYGPLPTASTQRLHGGKQKPADSLGLEILKYLQLPHSSHFTDGRVLPCLLSVSDHAVQCVDEMRH